jgi:hypothetical protein
MAERLARLSCTVRPLQEMPNDAPAPFGYLPTCFAILDLFQTILKQFSKQIIVNGKQAVQYFKIYITLFCA